MNPIAWVDDFRDFLELPSPAVLATYRRDRTVSISPVWYRLHGDGVEVVIAEGDPKLTQLRSDPRCVLIIFETKVPFRGMKFETQPSIESDIDDRARTDVSTRYLGAEQAGHFVAGRSSPGMVLRFELGDARPWSQSDTFTPADV